MVNREMFPASAFDFTKCVEQCVWFGFISNTRLGRIVRQRKNFLRAIVLARDNAARFVGRIRACVRDDLSKLSFRENQQNLIGRR